jgi:hypothetical protein
MDLKGGLPVIDSVSLNEIEKTIFVYEHWFSIDDKNHLPTSTEGGNRFVIDEVYDRFAWALNSLSQKRWRK